MNSGSGRPKLLFFGDPHGDFKPVVEAVDRLCPRAIVLLGDLQARRPLHVELAPIVSSTDIWWIPGNHDTDSNADYDNLFGSELAERNLHGASRSSRASVSPAWAASFAGKSGIRPRHLKAQPSFPPN